MYPSQSKSQATSHASHIFDYLYKITEANILIEKSTETKIESITLKCAYSAEKVCTKQNLVMYLTCLPYQTCLDYL